MQQIEKVLVLCSDLPDMKLLTLSLVFCFFTVYCSSAQTAAVKKKLGAVRAVSAPKIDGVLSDEVWATATLATDFIENRPVPGRHEAQPQRTEVRILYDDNAIYVGARMYDNPDSVVHELVARDQIGNADFISVIFDTFSDGMNANGFFVTAAGVQFDAKYSQSGDEDPNWNAVWESSVKRDELGWTAELRIPYSALRFSGKELQNWGLNFVRRRQKANQQLMWNDVDPKVSGFINQSGIWEGLKGIQPGVRLSFSPYLSTYMNHYPANIAGVKNTTSSFNGGMDVKYGINQSFTLDMTLIPDFGQIQADNRILNLTPFEVKFDERRQFFTEGTELFNKGDLFYSKRIGAIPAYFKDMSTALKDGETILKAPQEGKVLNATKISGRTAGGLGIGILNAVTNTMHAVVEDENGNQREVESQPLTNYNVFVLDQSLKNNSSVTLINTNVLRQGSDYDANVTAFLFNISDKHMRYFVKGAGKMSYLSAGNNGQEEAYGFNTELAFGKQSGSWTWNYTQKLADDKFDPSDLGFFTNNNFFDQKINVSYQVYKPGKWYNQWQSWANVNYSRRYHPSAYQNFAMDGGYYVQFKNFWSFEADLNWKKDAQDFYEARSAGKLYRTGGSYGIDIYVNPNRTKAYNLGGNLSYRKLELFDGKGYDAYLFQNLRLNDKIAFGLDLTYQPRYNYSGWVADQGSDILFSRYDRQTVENSADAKYSFSNKMGITFRVRHYWSDRRNKSFYLLNQKGMLDPYQGIAPQGTDRDYNVFNLDLIYQWQFAPGSELSIAYKNSAENSETAYRKRYLHNIDHILSGPQNNSLSVKMLYYIDYLDLRKKK